MNAQQAVTERRNALIGVLAARGYHIPALQSAELSELEALHQSDCAALEAQFDGWELVQA